MLKRVITASVMFTASLTTAFAATFYIGPTVSYESTNADNARFEDINIRVNMGYGLPVSELIYLSAEAFAGPWPIKVRNHINHSSGVNLKKSSDYGISLLPALILETDTLLFARFGVQLANFKYYNETKTGFQMGLGLDYRVFDCWTLRGEYDFTKYGGFKNTNTKRDGQFTVGILYNFSGSSENY